MQLDDAEQRTRRLMNQHGLAGWRLKFTHSPSRAGACYHTKRLIVMSKQITELNPWAGFVEDTALHEIAHALAGPVGHGRAWKAKALEIGATPTRCYSTAMKTPPKKWKAVCHCGTVYRRHHRPPRRREWWCGGCFMDLNEWDVWALA